jgi:hypothetical protein
MARACKVFKSHGGSIGHGYQDFGPPVATPKYARELWKEYKDQNAKFAEWFKSNAKKD